MDSCKRLTYKDKSLNWCNYFGSSRQPRRSDVFAFSAFSFKLLCPGRTAFLDNKFPVRGILHACFDSRLFFFLFFSPPLLLSLSLILSLSFIRGTKSFGTSGFNFMEIVSIGRLDELETTEGTAIPRTNLLFIHVKFSVLVGICFYLQCR